MRKVDFSELINIETLKKMAENLYSAAGIFIGILDADGKILIAVGWQDICTRFHRVHPETCKLCAISDRYIKSHLNEERYISYKCLNNMWDIAMPIIVAGEHLATIYFGQFFYDDEEIDIEKFRSQANKYGFDEDAYISALMNVPILSKEVVMHTMEYYAGLVTTLVESGLRELSYRENKKELEKNQRYLSTIFNSVSDAILIYDIDGNIIDINATAISMFSYSKHEIIGMNLIELVLRDSENEKFRMGKLIKKLKDKNPLIEEFVVRDKNQKEFWIEANFNDINIDEDKKYIATLRNITERKMAELAYKNETLEMEKLRTEFLANVSHELRTPLNIILCSIQVVEMHINNREKEVDRNRITNSLNMQRQNCYRLLRLINNLIDSTKIDSGHFESNMINCDIIDLLRQIVLSVTAYINKNDLKVVFNTNVKEKIMACDTHQIERIILNLISNSIKFTEPGGSIFVDIFEIEKNIVITVEDTGIGIPKEKLNLIFNRFAQVDKSFSRSNEGSGIGLAIVKLLVEMHDGTISVESNYGKGTKFTINIPVKVIENNDVEESTKLLNSTINNYLETIKVEFSDIYK